MVRARFEDEAAHTETPELRNIRQWVAEPEATGPTHAIVMAGPGSGKTQLVVTTVNRLNTKLNMGNKALVLTYNKDAVAELRSRGVLDAKTFHSCGLTIWRRSHPEVAVCQSKITDILKTLYPPLPDQPKKQKYREGVSKLIKHIVKLVALAKAGVLDPDSRDFDELLDRLVARHKIAERLEWELKGEPVAEPLREIHRMTKQVLEQSVKSAMHYRLQRHALHASAKEKGKAASEWLDHCGRVPLGCYEC